MSDLEHSAQNRKHVIGCVFGYSLKWRLFEHRITKNRHMKRHLLEMQGAKCTVCQDALGSKYDMHHIDYEHECRYGNQITYRTGKISERTGKSRTHSAPGCGGCQESQPAFFRSCADRLVLVHRKCHAKLHGAQNARSADGSAWLHHFCANGAPHWPPLTSAIRWQK